MEPEEDSRDDRSDGSSLSSYSDKESWISGTPTSDQDLDVPSRLSDKQTVAKRAAGALDPRVSVFPGRSANLIVAGSNSGKTWLLTQILKHRDNFFEKGYVQSIVYIHCNLRNAELEVENPFKDMEDLLPPVKCYSLSRIESLEEITRPNSVVILDDVAKVCEVVHWYVSYASNHLDVVTFVVSQHCLGEDIFKLLRKIHSLTLFFVNAGSASLGNYLASQFYIGKEKKKYLKQIFAECEAKKFLLNLRLNSVASSGPAYKKILAFANLSQLVDSARPYTKVYLDTGEDWNVDMKFGPEVEPDSFVLVRASEVKEPTAEESLEGTTCSKEKDWARMQEEVTSEIKQIFQPNKWSPALSFFREILRCKDFCISSDYRMLLLKLKRKVRVSLIDYITLAIRKGHPNESVEKYRPFLPFAKLMLRNKTPLSLMKNQKLLEFCSQKRVVLRKASKGKKNERFTWN